MEPRRGLKHPPAGAEAHGARGRLEVQQARVFSFAFTPNSEVAAAQSPGSAGHRPVPSGYQPLGATLNHTLMDASEVKGCLLAIPSGG